MTNSIQLNHGATYSKWRSESPIERITARPLSPINKAAAAGAYGGGAPNKPKTVSAGIIRSDAPFLTIPVPSSVRDFTGRAIGRFTVIGLLDNAALNLTLNQQRWSVKCVCSAYEIRKSKTLKKWSDGHGVDRAMCSVCDVENQRSLGKFSPSINPYAPHPMRRGASQ